MVAEETTALKASLQFADPSVQKQAQEKMLAAQLLYVQRHSAYYSALFAEKGIDAASVKTIEDLRMIPVTDKNHLQENWRSMIACAASELADFTTTSGTSGMPVTVPLSFSDIERLARNETCSYQTMELGAGDILQLTTTMDRSFMAGLAYAEGAKKMKLPMIRTGIGMPEMQWERIFSLGTTVLIAVPSFIIRLLDYAEQQGIDPGKSRVRKILCIGEPLRTEDLAPNALAERITQRWKNVTLYSTYASTEMQSAFTECAAGTGGHHNPDLIICEFLDEEGNAVKEGAAGELTITHLGVTGMPLIRFRTGDICHHYIEKCSCGRHTVKLGPIIGRKHQMIKLKGTSLYPPAFHNILDSFPEIRDYVILVNKNEFDIDEVQVIIETAEHSPGFSKKMKDSFKSRLRVTPEITYADRNLIESLRQSQPARKPSKFIDNRK